ncbi:hypothetical protein M0R04_12600 [Candidatus Dojkabacteria bacterium]|jgi:hypothetical protein|nr:hypothetical protein [Candidatus Dojkabacteria bacterium]
MTYYKQTEEKYRSIKLGNGEGSIYDYGCYMVSLCNGLRQKGYDYDPEQLNNILKVKNLWTGTTKNLIDVTNIVPRWFDVFTSFKRVDAWTTVPSLDEILKPDTIAIGEVSPVGIGGSSKGQHFVLITKKATNGHAIIYDPWRGIEEIIDTHWGSLGYIKSLRLFTVKPHVNVPPVDPCLIYKQENIKLKSELVIVSQERNLLKEKLEAIKNIVNG